MPLHPPTFTEREKGWVLVDRDRVVRKRFTATIHFVGGKLRRTTELPHDRAVGAGGVTGAGGVQVVMDVEVQSDGVPRCRRLEIKPQPPENQPLTATAVRVPIDRLMRVAVTDTMREVGPELPDGERWAIAPDLEEREDFHDSYRKGARRRRRRPDLDEVARIYRTALEGSEGRRARPTEAVVAETGVSRATAGRLISEARAKGFLGPAKHGVPSA